MAMPPVHNDKIRELLGGLGKPTMRGVRRCHKCGTFNGTRGISCKNKNCDAIFKSQERKKGHSAEAVKIITGSSVQLFSVRLRDRGPDYRGFVQLPFVQDLEGNPAIVDEAIVSSAAKCYVENCPRNSSTPTGSVQLCEACIHIKQAMSCEQEATAVALSRSALDSLRLSSDVQQAVWSLVTEDGSVPLVQRVTKNIMVVRCRPDSRHPMGFLHFGFYESARSKCQSQERKIICSCKEFKSSSRLPVSKEEQPRRCVHFYACLCAFTSDDDLAKEFAFCINQESASSIANDGWISGPMLLDQNENIDVIVGEISDVEGEGGVAIELEAMSPPQAVLAGDGSREQSKEACLGMEQTRFDSCIAPATKRRRKNSLIVQATNAHLTLQQRVSPPASSTAMTKQLCSLRKSGMYNVRPGCELLPLTSTGLAVSADEASVSLTFLQWLGSVTERINQTMHYQFAGYPDPLVFHAPQMFFDCLQQRISAGSKKKRLPNVTTSFVRNDALPLGTFLKYSWHITTVAFVRQIFDTPEVCLELTRNFMENKDGTYSLHESPQLPLENNDSGHTRGRKNQLKIRPHELKTFLKVGNATSPDQKEAMPFVIEWIPDILPQSKIGELRIKFEYGHQKNGVVEHRGVNTNGTEIQAFAV